MNMDKEYFFDLSAIALVVAAAIALVVIATQAQACF